MALLKFEQLVPDQKKGIEKLNKFLKSSERVFVLDGKAGTGKTAMLGVAFNKLINEDLDKINYNKSDEFNNSIVYNIIGVAMAHKAKENLRERGGIPYVNTFSSAYGHKEVYNERTGAKDFVPDYKKIKFADCKKGYKVFIIDEASMFNAKMLQLVLKETSMFSKIIFIGDRGQLPPIISSTEVDKGQDSPVWDLSLPDFCRHSLTKRVRQTEGNPIIEMSDVIYNEIFAETPNVMNVINYIKEDKLSSKGQGYISIDENDVYDTYKCSSDDYMDSKIIAYTNKTINLFNRHMRNFLHNNPQKQFIKNEIIYMNSTYYGEDTEGNSFAFYNSSEFTIKNLSYGEIDGIEVLYSELEDSKWMPIVKGGPGNQNYEVYKERLLSYSNVKNWKEFWKLNDTFGNFSYGYALTAYKAQGSTYKNIFISLADIMSLGRMSDKRKLQALYTAVTRASHNVYFLNLMQ